MGLISIIKICHFTNAFASFLLALLREVNIELTDQIIIAVMKYSYENVYFNFWFITTCIFYKRWLLIESFK